MSDKYELSRRKALAALGTIGVAGAGAGLGTSALYSDTETFTDNTITAGTSNLAVTLGLVRIDSSAPDELGINYEVGESQTADGEAVVGVQVGDMKPGDCIIVRATVDVQNNPMYVAVNGENLSQSEGATPEPELNVDTDGDAELAENLDITFGYDSDRSSLHDNTLEGGIEPDAGSSTFSGDVFLDSTESGFLYRGRQGADPASGPPGGHAGGGAPPTRIGGNVDDGNVDREKVTHFVKICLPVEVGNEVQGDSLSFDLVWNAEQVRNNPAPSDSGAVDGSANSG